MQSNRTGLFRCARTLDPAARKRGRGLDAIRTIESIAAADPGDSDKAWAGFTRAVDRIELALTDVLRVVTRE
jgi:hypothetical protein